jgi:hypothetical protein
VIIIELAMFTLVTWEVAMLADLGHWNIHHCYQRLVTDQPKRGDWMGKIFLVIADDQ